MSSGGSGRLRGLMRVRSVARRCLAGLLNRPGLAERTDSLAVQRVLQHFPSLPANEIARRLAYSTFVNFERRYMYFEVPKAGCTSIKALLHSLERLPPLAQCDKFGRPLRHDALYHVRESFPLPTIMDFDDAKQDIILNSPDFFRFTVVRNPYTRLASAWKDKVQIAAPDYLYLYQAIRGRLPQTVDDVITFEEFVAYLASQGLDRADPHWRPQTAHLFMPALNFSWIGATERMQETISKFGDHLGMDAGSSPRKHAAVGSVRYDKPTSEQVYRLYEQDFIQFGYTKESWSHNASEAAPDIIPLNFYLQEVLERNVVIAKLDKIRRELLQEQERAPRWRRQRANAT